MLLTPSLVIRPTIPGPMKPVTAAKEFEIPMIVDPYVGDRSIGFTMNPLKANPKKPTDPHNITIVPVDEIVYPEIIKRIPENPIPVRKDNSLDLFCSL